MKDSGEIAVSHTQNSRSERGKRTPKGRNSFNHTGLLNLLIPLTVLA